MGKPKIRFKGYEDDWEQRKLDGWGTFYYGRSCPKWSVTEDATIPCIRYGELYTKFGAKIDRVYSYTNMPPENLRFSKGTEVLIPRVGEDPMDYNHCTWLSMPDVAIGEMISVFNTDNNPLFTATMFNATLQNEFAMRVEGGSVTNLYFEKLKNIEVSFPSIQEQEKIAAYFENLDHLITLHQRKCYRFIDIALDAWEQRKLGNVLLSLQNNTLSRANLSDESGIAKNVHYGDVLIKFGEVLDVRKEKLPMITDENVLSKYKASFLQNGDVIVADTAEDSTVGKCSEIAGLNDEVVLSGLHTIPYRPIEKFASGYLGYYLNSGAYHNQLIPLMQGIKVTSISKSAMQNTDIDYPKSQEEQGKIGAYFKSLDEMITLHQRKCEETKSLKKYMLQKMFPENGKCVPKIRFSGFSDDWEQRKVGNFLTESREVGHKGDVAHKMTVKLWSKGICEKNEAGSSNTQYFIRHTGQFIYSKLDFLNCAFGVVPKNLESFETTADVPAFDCNEINPYFMFYTAIQPAFYKKNGIIADGSRKAKRIHVETFLNMPFFIPNLEEQNKIVDALSSLDHLITLHQHKCDELQKLKKFMLQNMFV